MHRAIPTFDSDHPQLRADFSFRIPQRCKLPEREAVADGDVPSADEAGEILLVESRAFGGVDVAADGVGAIENPQGLARLRAGFQDVRERPDVRVKPRADIGDVEEDRVEIFNRLRAWSKVFPI